MVTDSSGCVVTGSFSFGGSIPFPDSLFGYWNYEQDFMNFVFNLPVFSDSVICKWDFGDGSSADGATVSHTYGAEDEYIVTLNVYRNNGDLIYNQQIPVSPAVTTHIGERIGREPLVYPVPATDRLFLNTSAAVGVANKVEILNAAGQVLLVTDPVVRISENLIQLDISFLPAGFYIGKLFYNDDEVQSFRFVK